MKTTPQRLGLPEQLTRFNGLLVSTENVIPAIKEVMVRRFDRTTRKWVADVTRSIVPYKIKGNTFMAYNHLSELIHAQGFEVSQDGYSLEMPAKEFTVEVGPYAGQNYKTGAQSMTFERGFWTRKYHDPFRNADNDGMPHEGIIGLPVINETTFMSSPPKTIRQTYNKTFTRSELLVMGITTEMLAEQCYQRFELQTPSEETHLLNVSTDIEQLDENVYWPNVYFNGKDDNSFDFQKLVPFYAFKTPDFVLRVRAYNDSTNADYPEPNYSGMGNYGKCMDIALENEAVKPIRIEWGNTFGIENNADELVLTFDVDSQRAAIGIAVEYKPLDGKKVDHEIYMDVRTGLVVHDLDLI